MLVAISTWQALIILIMYTLVDGWPEVSRQSSSRDVEMPPMWGAVPLSAPLGASY